jgi:aryl-alcohol dehydrogenase-like predicted oxidoreductase
LEIIESRRLADAYGVASAQVALHRLINFYGAPVVAIPGASKTKQAAVSADAQQLRLTEKELGRLDELSP